MKYKTVPIKVDGEWIFRIISLIDFSDVKKGDMGGLIESENNLSHDGDCWIYDESRVLDGARVSDNAKIYGWCAICSDNARISGNAVVKDIVTIMGNTVVCWNAKITERTILTGSSWIGGNTEITGSSYIEDATIIGGNAYLKDARAERGDIFVKDEKKIGTNYQNYNPYP